MKKDNIWFWVLYICFWFNLVFYAKVVNLIIVKLVDEYKLTFFFLKNKNDIGDFGFPMFVWVNLIFYAKVVNLLIDEIVGQP